MRGMCVNERKTGAVPANLVLSRIYLIYYQTIYFIQNPRPKATYTGATSHEYFHHSDPNRVAYRRHIDFRHAALTGKNRGHLSDSGWPDGIVWPSSEVDEEIFLLLRQRMLKRKPAAETAAGFFLSIQERLIICGPESILPGDIPQQQRQLRAMDFP